MDRKGIEVGLRHMLEMAHKYPGADGSIVDNEGYLLVEVDEDENTVVLGMYAPGDWSYARYIQP